MNGYTKLFGSIIASTVWRESKETKILWVTMLAMADRNGIVEGSIPGLADMARLSIQETEDAMDRLQAPDPYSRTKDNDGRRVAPAGDGWLILNHAKYREKMGQDERREYFRNYRRKERAATKTAAKEVHGPSESEIALRLFKKAKSDAFGDSRVPTDFQLRNAVPSDLRPGEAVMAAVAIERHFAAIGEPKFFNHEKFASTWRDI
jgi:hypothetical protein